MTAALAQAGIVLGSGPTKTYLVEHAEHGLVVVELFDARFGDAINDVVSFVDALICLRHPNLGQVHWAGRVESSVAVTCEYVEGETLADLVRASNGALALEVRLRVLVDALAGLSALHAADLAVGTLTTSSVIIGTDGVSRLVGVYRGALGARGVPSVERRTLAPEIDLGHDPAPPSDAFSIGVMLWEAIGRRTLHDPRGAKAPQVPEDKAWAAPLAELAARALAIDPTKRPTPSEMAATIRMVARSKLATPNKVGDAVIEFASEHVVARRTRLAQSSGKIPVSDIVTPFDADTSPRGRKTITEEFQPEAPTDPKPAARPMLPSLPDEPTREILRPAMYDARATQRIERIERIETGPHPIAETPPRPSLASTGEHVIVTIPKKQRPAWLVPLVATSAIAAAAAGLFVGVRPHDAVSPVVPVVSQGSPGIATASPGIPAPSTSTRVQTSPEPSASSAPFSGKTQPPKAKDPAKAPLKRRDQYDPSSI